VHRKLGVLKSGPPIARIASEAGKADRAKRLKEGEQENMRRVCVRGAGGPLGGTCLPDHLHSDNRPEFALLP